MWIDSELEKLNNDGLLRTLRTQQGTGGKFNIDDKTWLNMSCNDYLDLSHDSSVIEASTAAVQHWGCSATASRLMSGHLQLHEDLEERLCKLTGMEAALLFGSGFLANLGVITTLCGRNDEVFADKLNHASLVDGVRLSGAKFCRYRHKDMTDLRSRLAKSTTKGRRLIISDSIFSMDGDIAPLQELAEIAKENSALLMIDEAHAVGIFGHYGGGVCQSFGIKPDILMGTLSKSFASYGGFAATNTNLKKLLLNKARSFIYSTALPPACLGSAIAAIDLVLRTPQLSRNILKQARYLHEKLQEYGFTMKVFESQILQIPVGDNFKALALAESLQKKQILVTAIRPPTVPQGTARLRLSITLAHDKSNLDWLAEEIANSAKKLGILS